MNMQLGTWSKLASNRIQRT